MSVCARLACILLAWLFLRPTVKQLRQVLRMVALITLHGEHRELVVADGDPLRFREITLTEEQYDWALDCLRSRGTTHGKARTKTQVVEAFKAARVTDLPPHAVDWAAIEREAEARGGSVIDLLFDRGHRREDEAA